MIRKAQRMMERLLISCVRGEETQFGREARKTLFDYLPLIAYFNEYNL